MRILGVPLSEIREAGRLDRRSREVRSWPPIQRWIPRGLGSWLGWAMPAGLLATVLWGSGGGRPSPWQIFLFLFSVPVGSGSRAPSLDALEALRMPSREALLLSRWGRVLPKALVAGIAWIVFLDRMGSGPTSPFLPAVLLGPVVLVAFVGSLSVVGWHTPEARATLALTGLVLGVALACLGALVVHWMWHAATGAALYLGAVGGLVGLGVAVWAFRTVRRTTQLPGWRRALFLRAAVRLGKCLVRGSWMFFLAWAIVGPASLLDWVWVGDRAAAMAVSVSVTALLGMEALRSTMRGVRLLDVGVGGEDEDREIVALPLFRPRVPALVPRRRPGGLFGVMVGDLVRRPLLLLLPLLGAYLFLISAIDKPGISVGLLFAAVLLLPKLVGLEPDLRLQFLGMDLRLQHLHNLKALVAFVALPMALAAAGALVATGWTPTLVAAALVLLSTLLLRAGFTGWSRLARRRRWGWRFAAAVAVVVLLFPIGSLDHGEDGGLRPEGVAFCLFAAALGAAGLAIHLRTLDEETLLVEVRGR